MYPASRSRPGAIALVLSVSLACSDRDGDAVPQAQARPADTASNGAAGAAQREARQGEGQGGGRGRSATITLATNDVATVTRASIEEGIPITGDLRPIETVEVRARIEGDLVAVLVREGQRVREGQLLARFESAEQESVRSSAEADRVAAQSEVVTAEWNLEQTTELYRAGAVAERDFKAAEQTVAAARARLAAAQARLRAANIQLRDTRVTAPTAGVIATRLVESGEHVARGAGMFSVVRSEVLELAAAVPARQAGSVVVGQNVRFVADGRTFDGSVARVSPTVDPATRSVTLYIRVPNPSGVIKGGTFASGRVVSRVVHNALVVPTAAIRQAVQERQSFVYRLAGNVVDVASVQLGVIDERGGMAQVLDGLAEGDRVITGNVGSLGRGMQVILAGEERTPARQDNSRQ